MKGSLCVLLNLTIVVTLGLILVIEGQQNSCTFYYRQTDSCVNARVQQSCNSVTVQGTGVGGSNCGRSAVNLFPGSGSYSYNCSTGVATVYSDFNCTSGLAELNYNLGQCSTELGGVGVTIGQDNSVCGIDNSHTCTVTIQDCTNDINCVTLTSSSVSVCYARSNYPGGYLYLNCADRYASFQTSPDCSNNNATEIPFARGCVNVGYGYSYAINYGNDCGSAASVGPSFFPPTGSASCLQNWIKPF